MARRPANRPAVTSARLCSPQLGAGCGPIYLRASGNLWALPRFIASAQRPFTTLPLNSAVVAQLGDLRGIHMPSSRRITLTGLTIGTALASANATASLR